MERSSIVGSGVTSGAPICERLKIAREAFPAGERLVASSRSAPAAHQSTDKADLYGGIALGIATLAALIIANSSLAPQYRALFDATGEIRIGSIGLSKSIEHWVNDGLMAIFFLLIGLEIKR